MIPKEIENQRRFLQITVGWATEKQPQERSDPVDPVTALVASTGGALTHAAAHELLQTHEGDATEALEHWRLGEACRLSANQDHTDGGESSGRVPTTVQPTFTSSGGANILDQAREHIAVEHGYHDAWTTAQPNTTPVSARSVLGTTARAGNVGTHATGGNTFHGSILGNPILILHSETLAFEWLSNFEDQRRAAPTLNGILKAVEIHSDYVDQVSARAAAAGRPHPAAYSSHRLGIFSPITDPAHEDLLMRLAEHSQMYSWYVRVGIMLGFDPADRLPSGVDALERAESFIAMVMSSYAPRTHTRNAHHNAPRRGGVYALETLGRMHHLIFQQGGGNIDVLVVDILPNFPGRSSTLSGGMRNVYDILRGFSPSARALLVRTAVGLCRK